MFRKKAKTRIEWDSGKEYPAVLKSICTGEASFGLVDRASGRFSELQLVRSEKELEELIAATGLKREDVPTIY